MELRPYQKEDVEKLLTKNCMGCFNEQRTGKTPTAITVMKQRNIEKLVIVCPNSAILNWKKEFELWDGRPAIPVIGTKKQKQQAVASWKNGAVIISYDSFKETKRGTGLIDKILQHNPKGIILDEAHKIKNKATANAQAAFKCIKIPYRLALTGTPCTKEQQDIWSILHFLYPSTFTSYWNFIYEYFKVDTVFVARNKAVKKISHLLPHKEKQLQDILSLISTQRKRRDIMQWLPEKDIVNINLPKTEEQHKYLTELQEYFKAEHVITQGVLDRLVRYRQICLAPELLNLKGNSPKLDWILSYLQDYPNKPTIIFSKFTGFIQLLQKNLCTNNIKYATIVGATSVKNREQYITDFQKGLFNVLLINIDAGKEAITLDRAETIIFSDKYPPVSDIQQAEDRFVATSIERADKPHTIYNLMMSGSYDECIYRMLEKSASETDILNDYNKYIERR